MSDVIAVAIITGGIGLAGQYMTARSGKRGTEAALAIAERNAAIELERIRAENERLREQYREDERRNRQGTYHRLIALLDRLDSFATGYPPTDEQYDEAVSEFNFLHAGLLLFGTPAVTDATAPLVAVFAECGAAMGAAEGSKAERWKAAYLPRRKAFIEAEGMLLAKMHADVTRGVLPE